MVDFGNVDQNITIEGGDQELNMVMNSGDSDFIVVQEVEIDGGTYVTDGTNILGNALQFLKVSQPNIEEGCEPNAILELQATDENAGTTYIQFGDQLSQVRYFDDASLPILDGSAHQQLIITSEPEVPVGGEEISVSGEEMLVHRTNYVTGSLVPTVATVSPTRKYIPHSRSILKKSLQQKDDVMLQLCEKNGVFIECPKTGSPLETVTMMTTTAIDEPVTSDMMSITEAVELSQERVIVQDANQLNEVVQIEEGNLLQDDDDPLVTIPLQQDETFQVVEELKETIEAMEVDDNSYMIETEAVFDNDGDETKESETPREVKVITSRSPEALPRFLQVDAKVIQDALKMHSANQMDEGFGFNPVFKICKMARKSDGSIECAPMNMRDLTLGDRQRVYQAMLEKFPDIVKKQAANVMTPQHMSKLDPKLQSSLKTHRGQSKLTQPIATNATPKGSKKKRFIRSMINDVTPTPSRPKTKPTQTGRFGNVTIVSSSPANDDPLKQSFLPETPDTSTPTYSGVNSVMTNGTGTGSGLQQLTVNSKLTAADLQQITLIAENAIKANQQAILNAETSASEQQPISQSIDKATDSIVERVELLQESPAVSKPLTGSASNAAVVKTNVKTDSVSMCRAGKMSNSLAMQMLCKKVTILPPPPHSCKKQNPNTCMSCKMEFESETAFEEHCLLQHLEVLPHFFAVQCQFHCTLCRKEKKRLLDCGESLDNNEAFSTSICEKIDEAKEHFRSFHYNEQVSECEMCKLLVKVDHMYAASQDVKKDESVGESDVACLPVAEIQTSTTEVPNLSESSPAANSNKLASDVPAVVEETQPESKPVEITKPSDIHRILRCFDKDHRKGQTNLSKSPAKKLYKCRYCEKEFQKRSIWKMHVLAHLGKQVFII